MEGAHLRTTPPPHPSGRHKQRETPESCPGPRASSRQHLGGSEAGWLPRLISLSPAKRRFPMREGSCPSHMPVTSLGARILLSPVRRLRRHERKNKEGAGRKEINFLGMGGGGTGPKAQGE